MTTRTKYERGNTKVDIDVADWGFRVGEIEILVEDEAAVGEAMTEIERVAKELGERVSLELFVCLRVSTNWH